MTVSEADKGRRRCIRTILTLGAGILAGAGIPRRSVASRARSTVVVVRTEDRAEGIRQAVAWFDLSGFFGADVAIKANYNSADPFPASTHPETLETLILSLKGAGCYPLTLAERSGMGDTRHVLKAMGAAELCTKYDVKKVILDELGGGDYVYRQPRHSHWQRGFLVARPFVEAAKVVQTCCLKTHQYGGHFTLSLKNMVGAVAKSDPDDGYNYMTELHSSERQRSMIAEIGQAVRSDLIVMDAMKAFVSGGPHAGKEVSPGLIIAGNDPVAVDAVGVAVLRLYGTTPEVEQGRVFDQEQIRRAAEIGLGATGPSAIELVGVGKGADELVARIREKLA
ncbi:DUF362 domain-containing protein [Pseudodesulfovibrio cashew]|uniref:DUF362 domain-containing protein n=1 Tax=Pseudodesulfovibrio cashew TaxID=2678688 RepID=A0A6I6JP87_9BACT|nr:DUF362 domain-containing protein [Pseudodesulfovibrio cashew]QGY39434.1 DUF362 domain-containing protein [Pseudodesulfovibrio cashew]